MSDELKSYDFKKIKHDISVDTNHSLQYVNQQCVNAEEIVITIHITNQTLKAWQYFRQAVSCTFIDILNDFLAENHAVLIKEDNTRIEEHLRRLASAAKSNSKGKAGSTFQKFSKATRNIAIRYGELRRIAEVERELCDLKAEKKALEEENKSLHQRCDELYQSLLQAEELKKGSEEKLSGSYAEIEKLKMENSYLCEYIDKIAEKEGFENTGRTINEVGERQQRRKLRELKSYVEKALWFAETFGLQLSAVEFKDAAGIPHTMEFQTAEIAGKKSYEDLPESEKEKVEQILFITDKFCIGEAAYHELTMANEGEELPRSYLVKQCKNHLNSLCHIKRTPGAAEGAQLEFESELKNTIRKQIDLEQFKTEGNKLRVKISGDGARMTRFTSFVVMSFSMLDSDDVMSSKGTHTVAVVKGHESYDLFKHSFADLFSMINKITKEGKLTVDEHDIPVEMFLGGDYKFLLLLLGMKGATSHHACIWCTIHKNDRFDMSKAEEYYCQAPTARTLAGIKECARHLKLSCAHQPLLDIPLHNVILDELHLMLRVTDVLTKNLVTAAINWDMTDNLNRPPSKRTSVHIDSLVAAINSCGVCFKVWEKPNADGKGSGTFECTSLMGTDKKLLLTNLPEKLHGVINAETSNTVIKIWKDFSELYLMLDEKEPSNEYIVDYFEKAKKWISLFTSLGGICPGYAKANVTPYMHAMIYHIPKFMRMHGGMKKFSGQGTEKNNDDCRRFHLNKSNKWDASTDVLLVMKRLEALSGLQRTPRTYEKRNADYWDNEVKEKRVQHKCRRMLDRSDENTTNNNQDTSNMSPSELREALKKMGITTRARNVKRLQEMFQDALNSQQDKM